METAPDIFDRRLLALRRERAAVHVRQVAPILEAAAALLLDRLDDTTRRFSRALDVGGRGAVAPALSARGIPFVVSMDLAPAMARQAGGLAIAGDEEWLPFAAGSFDLILANLSLHAVNDLPGALIQLRRALSPDGLFLASLPGFGTLQGLREALAAAEAETRGGVSPRIAPFPELRDLAGLLQRAGFALPVADQDRLPLEYRTPMGLVADLRAAGEGNVIRAADRRTPPRALFPLAFAALDLRMELRLLIMTGWAPHDSQQKPARPGSANARLAEALGTREYKAGENAG
ncbi:class I SAM-dependent methyltransferase [Sediminicoccus sp. KRV36]|uniref:class I SAM-dependent methyltransferase n=1 Tax=Sediminicoccus sp. KRV36 TaxID=3133721 RepID=UPI00200ED598|nr:class I SAM-dependent methyltransferase [Sediminicoccus rosea]UPY37332.1 class I SAM-dependent methyltransferase [Sediminicoccus rosea]